MLALRHLLYKVIGLHNIVLCLLSCTAIRALPFNFIILVYDYYILYINIIWYNNIVEDVEYCYTINIPDKRSSIAAMLSNFCWVSYFFRNVDSSSEICCGMVNTLFGISFWTGVFLHNLPSISTTCIWKKHEFWCHQYVWILSQLAPMWRNGIHKPRKEPKKALISVSRQLYQKLCDTRLIKFSNCQACGLHWKISIACYYNIVKMRENKHNNIIIVTLLHYCIISKFTSGSSPRVAVIQLEEHGKFMWICQSTTTVQYFILARKAEFVKHIPSNLPPFIFWHHLSHFLKCCILQEPCWISVYIVSEWTHNNIVVISNLVN